MFATYFTTPRARVDGEQQVVRSSSWGDLRVTLVGSSGGADSISNTMRSTALSTASVTVAGTTTVSILLAANQARKSATFTNPGPAVLLLDASTAPTTAAYMAQLAAGGGYYELPYPVYTGPIQGIWASSGSTALGCAVREFI